MAKKTRMGRDLNALLGGASRTRKPAAQTEEATAKVETPAAKPRDAEGNSAQPSSNPPKSKPSPATKSASEQDTTQAIPADKAAATDTKSSAPTITIPANVNLSADQPQAGERVLMLGVDQIKRGSYQPRRHFSDEKLQELAESISQQGVIQPILVRKYAGSYELIAGERRWRASQLAGINEIPVIVRDMDDQAVAAVALIENIQRADLNPLEEAEALQRLCEEFSMTHQAVADSVGRSRAAVSNLLRLLELHDDVKPMIDMGDLEMGHARALLGAPRADQPNLARRIVKENLTVRAVETMIRSLREGKPAKKLSQNVTDPNIDSLGKKLGEVLGSPVKIHHKKSGSGKLEISYTSVSELEGILGHIK